MKSVFLALTFVLTAVTFQANAATYTKDLGMVTNNANIGRNNIAGSFEDTYHFQLAGKNGAAVSLTNSFIIKGKNKSGFINDFKATLDNIPLVLKYTKGNNFQLLATDPFLVLAKGIHQLVVTGDAGKSASYGGSLQVSPVPVPAAIWMFGSALMGLMGVSRRKKA